MVKSSLGHGIRLATSALLVAGLVACGGGGGGGSSSGGGGGGGGGITPPPSTPVAVTATNAEQVAATAFESAIALVDTGAVLPVSASSAGRSIANRSQRVVARANQEVVRAARSSLSSPTPLAREVLGPYPCDVSGDVTFNYADDGSSASVTFNNCSDYPGEAINGSITVSGVSGSELSFSATVAIDLTFTATGYPTERIVGGYTISVSCSTSTCTSGTYTFSGSSLLATDGTYTWELKNFNFTETFNASTVTLNATYTVASSEMQGQVTVTTPTPFVVFTNRLYPHQGVAVATGSNNSKVQMTVLGNETAAAPQVRIEVDADGDGAYETTINTTWAALTD